jgi:hypothetical protein
VAGLAVVADREPAQLGLDRSFQVVLEERRRMSVHDAPSADGLGHLCNSFPGSAFMDDATFHASGDEHEGPDGNVLRG